MIAWGIEWLVASEPSNGVGVVITFINNSFS
jgi:hypothetical protein